MLDHIHIYLNNHDVKNLLHHRLLFNEFNIVVGKNTNKTKGFQTKAIWSEIKFVIKKN
jgi:hypothetical protein